MASLHFGTLPAMRRQHLQAEFSGLKQACPEGVFVSLTPGDAALWAGVLFVRKGPYAPAILRFQISFPDAYPSLPPLVTFSTDMFHPLITPLTTYMYTTDIQDNGTVSASDEERLPPGGFSLRHGFPRWFGRGRRPRVTSGQQDPLQTPPRPAAGAATSMQATPSSTASMQGSSTLMQGGSGEVSIYDVLRYIRSTFDDEVVLDAVPLEAAGNPGAWHAWRTHQRQQGKGADVNGNKSEAGDIAQGEATPAPDAGAVRKPGEWNWEHVWEERVKKGIAASLSEPVLYGGGTGSDDVIRFLNIEQSDVDLVKDNLKRTLGAVGVAGEV